MQDVIASLQSCVDNLAFACGTPQIGYRSQTAEIEQLRLELTNANLIQMTLQGNLSAATLKLKEAREEIENLQKQVEKLQRGVAAKAPPQGQ
jgi:septation ring formation regulator EzrA